MVVRFSASEVDPGGIRVMYWESLDGKGVVGTGNCLLVYSLDWLLTSGSLVNSVQG